MMRKLIFIFLIFHVHIFNCSKLPKLLKCIDETCEDRISTGRIIKSTNPIHGNLEFLKSPSQVYVRGKNVDSKNTLWLVEQEGYYGFVDLSFIKEIKNTVIEDLTIVQNPYDIDSKVDETEDSDDNINGGLFSKENIKNPVISIENDETENFSEVNSKNNTNNDKKIDNVKNVEVSKEIPNVNDNITNLNSKKDDKLENNKKNINNANAKILESSDSNKEVVGSVNIQSLKETNKEILKSINVENSENKDNSSQNIKSERKEKKITVIVDDGKVVKDIDSKEKIEIPKVEVKVDYEKEQKVKIDNKEDKPGEKENLHYNNLQYSDKYLKNDFEVTSKSFQNSEKDLKPNGKDIKATVTVDEQKSVNKIDSKEKIESEQVIENIKAANSKVQQQPIIGDNIKDDKSVEKMSLNNINQQNSDKNSKTFNEIVNNNSQNSEKGIKSKIKTTVIVEEAQKLVNNIDSAKIKSEKEDKEVKAKEQPKVKIDNKDDKSVEKSNLENIEQRNSDKGLKTSHNKDLRTEINAKLSQDLPTSNDKFENAPSEDTGKPNEKQVTESSKPIENVNLKPENQESDLSSNLKYVKRSESPPNNSANENSENQIPPKIDSVGNPKSKIQLKSIDISEKLTESSKLIENDNNKQINPKNIDLSNSLMTESPPNNSANENSGKQIPQKTDTSVENPEQKPQLKLIDNSDRQSDRLENTVKHTNNVPKEESIQKQDIKDIPKEPIQTIKNDLKYSQVHSNTDIKSPENISDIQSKEINENKINQSEMKSNEIDNNQLPIKVSTNSKSKIETHDKLQINKLKKETKQKSDIKIPSEESIKGDPWLDNSGRLLVQNVENDINQIRSPIIKLIMKIDCLSQLGIKYVTSKLGFDSSSKFSQFTNYWLQMPLESFVSIFLLFSVLFFIVYAPKLLKFNRDWKSELVRQTELLKELEQKLQTTEEVRHKLTVQNHNFEKVIDEYKQQINEIQEDAAKNKKTVILEIEKIKKSNELNVKNLTNDLANKMQQCHLLENDLANKINTIENLEETKRQMEIQFDDEKSQLEVELLENKRELNRIGCLHDQLKHSHRELSTENEELKARIEELNRELVQGNESYCQLEKSFEHLKAFEGLNFEEFNEKKSIYLDLTQTKERLEASERNAGELSENLQTKTELIQKLEQEQIDMKQRVDRYENEKTLAVAQKEAAEIKLQVLREYFQSKEMEMAKSLGHQVIETNQSMDQLDFLKHRIGNLESENEEMSKTVQKLKSEIKESQTFATKCKTDANEEINRLFLKNMNLERSLQTEKDENKKLRTKLSHYCGPTPPRNQTSNYNHNNKDRPPSRQSGISEPVTTFVPLSFIPFTSPQSPIPNSNQFSGRNSVNSKKSNNT